MAAVVVFLLVVVLALIGPFLATTVLGVDPNRQDLTQTLKGPTLTHWVGTDEYGRDAFARLLAGGGISLMIGFIVAVVALTLGVGTGILSGYYGGWVDDLSNAVIQTLSNIPTLLLLILLFVTFRPGPVMLAVFIGALGWMGVARQVRGMTLSMRQQSFIEAATVVGADDLRIMIRHILPNLVSIVLVVAAFEVASGILVESGLSFLGLGVQAPQASWGNMLTNSLEMILRAPWLVIGPGVMIFITVLCIFLIADGLRDAFDPRLKQ